MYKLQILLAARRPSFYLDRCSVIGLMWTHGSWLVSYCSRWWFGRRPRWSITEVPSSPHWGPVLLPTCSLATITRSNQRLVKGKNAETRKFSNSVRQISEYTRVCLSLLGFSYMHVYNFCLKKKKKSYHILGLSDCNSSPCLTGGDVKLCYITLWRAPLLYRFLVSWSTVIFIVSHGPLLSWTKSPLNIVTNDAVNVKRLHGARCSLMDERHGHIAGPSWHTAACCPFHLVHTPSTLCSHTVAPMPLCPSLWGQYSSLSSKETH